MKPTIALAALLAGLASAEKVPVLSEPRVLAGRSAGISFDAWGDTLIASRYGLLYRIVRRGDVVNVVDSVMSDSLTSEMPRVLPTGLGYHLVCSNRNLMRVGWIPGTAPATSAVSNLYLSYSRVDGGFAYNYNGTTSPERHLVLCAGNRSYSFLNVQGPTWRVEDSIVLPTDAVTRCDIDASTNQAVRLTYSSTATGAQVATSSAPNLLGAVSTATPFRPTTIFAGYDGAWLGFNTNNGSVYLGGRSQNDSIQHDWLRSQIQTFVAPVRKDSLIVFAVDSSLVLAKWTVGNFRLLNRVKLDGRVSYGMAIADSTLWVNVDSKVLSFRVAWLEGIGTRIGTRATRSDLAIQGVAGGLEIRSLGSTSNRYSILTLQGTTLANGVVGTGESAVWQAPHAGLYLVKTSDGSKAIMVK